MKRRVLEFCCGTVLIAALGLVVLNHYGPALFGKEFPQWGGEVTAAILTVAIALIAIFFQWRIEFVTSLREVWKLCLEGYAEARVLYRLEKSTEADVTKALRAMSIAIDAVRSVYKNIGETQTHVGYYPYAPLHDIRLVIQTDHRSGALADPEKRKQRAAQLDAYWRTFRLHFLSEFNPPEPDHFIITRLQADKRKPNVSIADAIRIGRIKPGELLTEEDLQI